MGTSVRSQLNALVNFASVDAIFQLLAMALAAVLLVAGASKLFSPDRLAANLRAVSGVGNTKLARAVGVAEIAAAVLVSLPAVRPLGAGLGLLIGLGIAGWVTLAMRRQVTASCGCFGGSSTKPLGPANLFAGLGLALGFGVLVAYQPAWDPAIQLAAVETLAVLVVVAMRLRDFYPLLRKGLGAGQ